MRLRCSHWPNHHVVENCEIFCCESLTWLDLSRDHPHICVMSYRTLDPDKIVQTLERLNLRISERFPDAGLAKVCKELEQVARETRDRARSLRKPNELLRIGSAVVVIIGLGLIAYVGSIIDYKNSTDNLFGVLQGIEALMNIIVLMGAAIFFLTTLEARWKRHKAVAHLHELRTIVHVIDMHQLTKDPSATVRRSQRTKSSPARTMTPFELIRYLDYCSEMYSLTAKVATLYAQSSSDSLVISTITEIEQVTANLGAKVWQKIDMIQADENKHGAQAQATASGSPTPEPANEA